MGDIADFTFITPCSIQLGESVVRRLRAEGRRTFYEPFPDTRLSDFISLAAELYVVCEPGWKTNRLVAQAIAISEERGIRITYYLPV